MTKSTSRDNSVSHDSSTADISSRPQLETRSFGMSSFLNVVKCITVEPALFLYMVSSFLHFPVFQSLIYEKSCLAIYDQNINLCSNDTATHKDLNIQAKANLVFMLSSVCFTIPSFISTTFLGSYGDRRSRKIALLSPYLGLVISDINFIVQSTYMRFNVYYLLISDFFFSLFGGYSGLISTSFSYGAQMTASSNRSYRMAFLEGCIGIGGTIGYLFSGITLHAVGYRSLFLINMALHCMAFLYIVFFLSDTTEQIEKRRRKQGAQCVNEEIENSSSSANCPVEPVTTAVEDHACCWWFMSYFRDAISVFKKRSGDKRLIVISVLMAFSVSFFVFSGSQDIMFYYLKHELNWSSATYGIFRGVYFGSSSATILFIYPLLRYWGVHDWTLAAVGLLSRLIGSLMLCFPFSTWFVFCVSAFYMFNRFAATGMRSIASQQVEKDEQGKVFAAIALIEAICSLLASLVFNSLYTWSLLFFPGLCYALMTALMVIPLLLVFCVGFRIQRGNVPLIPDEATPVSSHF